MLLNLLRSWILVFIAVLYPLVKTIQVVASVTASMRASRVLIQFCLARLWHSELPGNVTVPHYVVVITLSDAQVSRPSSFSKEICVNVHAGL